MMEEQSSPRIFFVKIGKDFSDQLEHDYYAVKAGDESYFGTLSEGDFVFPIFGGHVHKLWRFSHFETDRSGDQINPKVETKQEQSIKDSKPENLDLRRYTVARFETVKHYGEPIYVRKSFIFCKFFELDQDLLVKTSRQTKGKGFFEIRWSQHYPVLPPIEIDFDKHRLGVVICTEEYQEKHPLALGSDEDVIRVIVASKSGFKIQDIDYHDSFITDLDYPLRVLYDDKNPKKKYSLEELLDWAVQDNAKNKVSYLKRLIKTLQAQGFYEVKDLLSFYDSVIVGRLVTKHKDPIDELVEEEEPTGESAEAPAEEPNISNVDTEVKSEPVNNKLALPTFDNDGAKAPHDLLGFDKDIRSFSALVALKELKPPVAIALFGDWGSGKSFFMNQMQNTVVSLSEHQGFEQEGESSDAEGDLQEDRFCKEVLQITCNAWSYLDSNLWAALVSEIFEKIDEYIKKESKSDQEKAKVEETISEKLAFVGEHRNHLIKNREELEAQKKRSIERLQALKSEKEDLSDKVLSKSINELKDEVLQEELDKFDETTYTALESYGVSKEDLKLLSPENVLAEVKSAKLFFKQLNSNWWVYALGLAVTVSWILFAAYDWGGLHTKISTVLSDAWLYIVSLGAPVLGKAISAYKKFRSALEPIQQFSNSYNEQLKIATLEYQKEIDLLHFNVQQIEVKMARDEREIEVAESELKTLEFHLQNSITQLAFTNFIEGRAGSKEYREHLGIISTIRKDFETLSELFQDLSQLNTENETEEQKKKREEIETFQGRFDHPLERIVLYIDDLDRCPDDIVLEVLQAVHLLMAFPLFVVVVGVDQRCVYNALNYRNMLQYSQLTSSKKPEDLKEYGIHIIKPQEYLEKIFQIPFQLAEPEEEGIKDLVVSMLEDQVEKKPITIPTTSLQEIRAEIDAAQSDPALERRMLADEAAADAFLEMEMEADIMANDLIDDIDFEEEESTTPNFVAPPVVKISSKELEYISAVIVLIGTSPRSIKRFVNIYRIIRGHEQFSYDEDEKDKDCLIVMFVLSICIGQFSDLSAKLSADCLKSEMDDLQTILDSLENGNPVLKLIEKNDVLKQLLSENGERFNKYYPFVSRFSFEGRS